MPETHTMPQQQSHMDYASASLSQALRFWLKLDLIRFGGPPAGQISPASGAGRAEALDL